MLNESPLWDVDYASSLQRFIKVTYRRVLLADSNLSISAYFPEVAL